MYVLGSDAMETMGFLGLSWEEKLASDLFNVTGDTNLKNAWYLVPVSGSVWDVNYVDKIESFYKQGTNNGLSGTALAAYIKTSFPDLNPATADAYINLRPDAGNESTLENAVSSITSPVAKAAGGIVSNVTQPLSLPLMLIAGVAVIGFIAYTQMKKGGKSNG